MNKVICPTFYDNVRSLFLYYIFGIIAFMAAMGIGITISGYISGGTGELGELFNMLVITVTAILSLLPFLFKAIQQRRLLKQASIHITEIEISFSGLERINQEKNKEIMTTISLIDIVDISLSKYAVIGVGYYKGSEFEETKFYGYKLEIKTRKKKYVFDMGNTNFQRGQLQKVYNYLKKSQKDTNIEFHDPNFFAEKIKIEDYPYVEFI